MKVKVILDKVFASKFSKDTLWLIAAQVVLMGAAFLINILIGMFMGGGDLGVFNQSLAYYMILSTFFALGQNNTIIKKVAEEVANVSKTAEVFSSSLLITIIGSSFLSVLAIGLALWFPHLFSSAELANAAIVPFYTLPLFNMNKNFMAFNTGRRCQRQFAVARMVRWIVIFLYIIFCILFELDVYHLMFAFPISEGILFIYHVALLRKAIVFKIRFDRIRDNLLFGLKSYVAEIISVLNASMDVILIGYFLTNGEVGIYSFILFFVKTLYVFPGILMQNVNPIISRLWAENELAKLNEKIRKLKRVNFVVISFQLLFLLIGYKLVILFIKEEFVNTYWYFLLALIGVFVYASISWSGAILVMTGKLKENTYRTTAIILLSATSTILLTYFFGLTGSVVAVSLNGLIAYLMLVSFIHRVLGIKIN